MKQKDIMPPTCARSVESDVWFSKHALVTVHSGGHGIFNVFSSTFDLFSMYLLATEPGTGFSHPLWDPHWNCVWWAGTSPEVKGEKSLPLWRCACLCQHKCQVSPFSRTNQAKCRRLCLFCSNFKIVKVNRKKTYFLHLKSCLIKGFTLMVSSWLYVGSTYRISW